MGEKWGGEGPKLDGFSPNKNLFPTEDLCDACGQPRASPLAPAAKAAAPKGPKVGQRSVAAKGWGFLGIPRFWLEKKHMKNIICISY